MELRFKQISQDIFIYFSENKNKFEIKALQDIGYIHFVLIPNENEVNVCFTFVSPKYRGKGLGQKLMEAMFMFLNEKMRSSNVCMYKIYLDDMSERYGTNNNLYIKMGFSYDEIVGSIPNGPEMTKTIKLV
jgi:GNAT superfamily N-acetyltransferase